MAKNTPPPFVKRQVAKQQAAKKKGSGFPFAKKAPVAKGKTAPSKAQADPATQNNVEGYTYNDLPDLRKQEKALEQKQMVTSDLKKKQALRQQELHLESIITKLTT